MYKYQSNSCIYCFKLTNTILLLIMSICILSFGNIHLFNIDTHSCNHIGLSIILIGKQLSTFVAKKYTPNINMILDSTRCDLKLLKNIKGIKSSEWISENQDLTQHRPMAKALHCAGS